MTPGIQSQISDFIYRRKSQSYFPRLPRGTPGASTCATSWMSSCGEPSLNCSLYSGILGWSDTDWHGRVWRAGSPRSRPHSRTRTSTSHSRFCCLWSFQLCKAQVCPKYAPKCASRALSGEDKCRSCDLDFSLRASWIIAWQCADGLTAAGEGTRWTGKCSDDGQCRREYRRWFYASTYWLRANVVSWEWLGQYHSSCLFKVKYGYLSHQICPTFRLQPNLRRVAICSWSLLTTCDSPFEDRVLHRSSPCHCKLAPSFCRAMTRLNCLLITISKTFIFAPAHLVVKLFVGSDSFVQRMHSSVW